MSGLARRARREEIAPRRRVILLGASNLARGISTVVETARRLWGRPLDVRAALGHGRSYGRDSRVFGRELPGITECGLWQGLQEEPAGPTVALVTDIGNDLLYGASVDETAGWVEQCLDRLAAIGARTVVTPLPVENIPGLSVWRYQVMRALMFPRSRLSLATVVDRALELNDCVRRMAIARDMKLAPQRVEWYGFDPIHIKFGHWTAAWGKILSPWSDSPGTPPRTAGSLARSLYLRTLTPARRRILGFEQRGKQPAGRLRDGTTIALY